MRETLADLILAAHFLLALGIVAGLPLIWIGAARGWSWVRSRRLRLTHLAAICVVTLEALAGIACPLTVWEHALRGSHDSRGFFAYWIAKLLYYDLPAWMFTVAYAAFAGLVWATWVAIPPRLGAFRT